MSREADLAMAARDKGSRSAILEHIFCLIFVFFVWSPFFGTERPAALGVGKLMPAGWWRYCDSGREKEAFPIGGKGGGRLRKHFEKCVGKRGLLPSPSQGKEEEEREEVTGVFAWCCKGFVSVPRCLKESQILR